ncbi:MAG: hypothetical protein BYD32DRAFT_462572 [Podila humilis]|nr:MAG: hypothetical protein BYD32DRAFT_462572 [Podila humilis]
METPGSLYPRHITYPSSGKRSQPECVDVSHVNSFTDNKRYRHPEQQRDIHNRLHTRTPHILDASPAELSVYLASRQDAQKQPEKPSIQSYLFPSRKCNSTSSKVAIQTTTKALSPLLGTVEELPSSGTHEAKPLSPIFPLSSSVALRHQASRRLSCGGRLETYLETEQDRLLNRDQGKGVYRRKHNSLIISTSFPVTDALRDTSMSSVSDAGSDRRASISSSLSDISIRMTHSTVSLSSSSGSTSIHDIPRESAPPVHYTPMNLKLLANYYIDVEFQWQGNTYMILDATHWQWAREQVNHGDMAIRCNIW